MSGADKDREISDRFSQLLTAIRASQHPQDVTDRIRDALDRKSDRPSDEGTVFIDGSFAVDAVAYESETTQILQVRQRDLGDCFAVKTVPVSRRDDPVLVHRLRREAKIGLGLRHPCLQEISALLRLRDGRPGLLQPWVPSTLAALLKTRQPSLDEISRVLHRVLRGLSVMHDAGYVHCDVSPSNIMLPENDIMKARLGDFGITLQKGKRHADLGIAVAGSPEFSAPEQLAGAPAHAVHDIYAAGRLAERLLAGHHGEERPALIRFIHACTRNEATTCPQNADDAINFLESGR
ncbi:protein kinase domain-containing protein [Agrobacterium rubi]|uniref:Protein kinase n=2 Tax=Agrobacterium rubi TaxID=28099 RepID=A0AAE7RCD9_9HYPH|nr:protein kinase [Agrobacterium rubi]MBP1878654.1 type VI secretion system protein ImpN [Agrobacterium rubi]NTE88723.1 protein kinase [Agrobacterium rubi]NTF04551.1 protein kinase [Agrobacterium rubi]NTF10083.1 protein kinase [Agrobacterium rubi]NTF21739.1 protein kinase [Agrobacterium rubi]